MPNAKKIENNDRKKQQMQTAKKNKKQQTINSLDFQSLAGEKSHKHCQEASIQWLRWVQKWKKAVIEDSKEMVAKASKEKGSRTAKEKEKERGKRLSDVLPSSVDPCLG